MPGLPPHGRTQGPTGLLKFWRWWWWVGPPTTTSTHFWPCCAIASRPWSWGQVPPGSCGPPGGGPSPITGLAPTRKASLARACVVRPYGWIVFYRRTLLQRPFQQEFRGALGTRSTIINYGKEKRCALPAGTTCQSQSEWKKPAEVHGSTRR